MDIITYAFPTTENIDPSVCIDAYRLILECSNMRTPKDFIIRLIDAAERLCSYDQAVAFFFDGNKKIADFYNKNTREGWVESYLNYYITMTEIFSFEDLSDENMAKKANDIICWKDIPQSSFKREYIDAVHLQYSWSIHFFDMDGSCRVTVCFDRRHPSPYTKKDQAAIRLALPILNNIYRTFFYKYSGNIDTNSLWEEYHLTTREKEIADLLCQGTKASRISELLFISPATTHKHIAHIYKKVGVASHQELISRMLSKRSLL